MTELQKVFLFYTLIYFLVKGGIVAVFYLATILGERVALQKHEKSNMLYKKRREDEQARWKVAYSFYARQSLLE